MAARSLVNSAQQNSGQAAASWRQDTVAPSNSAVLLQQQNRDFVEEFIDGHDIRFPIAVYVRNGQRSKTNACRKVLRLISPKV